MHRFGAPVSARLGLVSLAAAIVLFCGGSALWAQTARPAGSEDDVDQLLRELNALEQETSELLERLTGVPSNSKGTDLQGLPSAGRPSRPAITVPPAPRYEQQQSPFGHTPLPAPPAVPQHHFASQPSFPPSVDEHTSVAPRFDEHIWHSHHHEGGKRLISRFEDGFVVSTEDEEFELRIRLMEQTDFKYFSPKDQEPARPGVYVPRFRSYFEGHVTQSFDYELSLQRSVEGTFDVLDANINFHPSDEFQVKLGRFLVPYSYDWYDHLEQFFITPERALFPLNFGLSREAGAMLWGELHDGRFQYALGAFSGQLAGLADNNTTRDMVAYVNSRPFRDSGTALENINVGGSLAFGDQAFPGEPLPLRTSIQASENDEAAQAASSVFLEFEEDVFYQGSRRQGALHLAWYVCQLSLEAEVQFGEFRFNTPTGDPTLPVGGYHISTGYFLTGEEVEGRSLVRPLDPFNPASGEWGLGAIEAFFRYSHLALGDEIFTEGLADPADWTRRAATVDLGWNWYPNQYVKFYFDWQISLYDTPVLVVPDTGERTSRSDLFWIRAQVFL